MLQNKTHYEQIPIETVRRIVEEQIRREEVGKANRDSAEVSFELQVWEAPEQPIAKLQAIFHESRKLS